MVKCDLCGLNDIVTVLEENEDLLDDNNEPVIQEVCPACYDDKHGDGAFVRMLKRAMDP